MDEGSEHLRSREELLETPAARIGLVNSTATLLLWQMDRLGEVDVRSAALAALQVSLELIKAGYKHLDVIERQVR